MSSPICKKLPGIIKKECMDKGILEKNIQMLESGTLSIRDMRLHFTDMTQNQFASRFDIPLNTLKHWEQGTQTPRSYVVKMIGKILALEMKLLQMSEQTEDINKE